MKSIYILLYLNIALASVEASAQTQNQPQDNAAPTPSQSNTYDVVSSVLRPEALDLTRHIAPSKDPLYVAGSKEISIQTGTQNCGNAGTQNWYRSDPEGKKTDKLSISVKDVRGSRISHSGHVYTPHTSALHSEISQVDDINDLPDHLKAQANGEIFQSLIYWTTVSLASDVQPMPHQEALIKATKEARKGQLSQSSLRGALSRSDYKKAVQELYLKALKSMSIEGSKVSYEGGHGILIAPPLVKKGNPVLTNINTIALMNMPSSMGEGVFQSPRKWLGDKPTGEESVREYNKTIFKKYFDKVFRYDYAQKEGVLPWRGENHDPDKGPSLIYATHFALQTCTRYPLHQGLEDSGPDEPPPPRTIDNQIAYDIIQDLNAMVDSGSKGEGIFRPTAHDTGKKIQDFYDSIIQKSKSKKSIISVLPRMLSYICGNDDCTAVVDYDLAFHSRTQGITDEYAASDKSAHREDLFSAQQPLLEPVEKLRSCFDLRNALVPVSRAVPSFSVDSIYTQKWWEHTDFGFTCRLLANQLPHKDLTKDPYKEIKIYTIDTRTETETRTRTVTDSNGVQSTQTYTVDITVCNCNEEIKALDYKAVFRSTEGEFKEMFAPPPLPSCDKWEGTSSPCDDGGSLDVVYETNWATYTDFLGKLQTRFKEVAQFDEFQEALHESKRFVVSCSSAEKIDDEEAWGKVLSSVILDSRQDFTPSGNDKKGIQNRFASKQPASDLAINEDIQKLTLNGMYMTFLDSTDAKQQKQKGSEKPPGMPMILFPGDDYQPPLLVDEKAGEYPLGRFGFSYRSYPRAICQVESVLQAGHKKKKGKGSCKFDFGWIPKNTRKAFFDNSQRKFATSIEEMLSKKGIDMATFNNPDYTPPSASEWCDDAVVETFHSYVNGGAGTGVLPERVISLQRAEECLCDSKPSVHWSN